TTYDSSKSRAHRGTGVVIVSDAQVHVTKSQVSSTLQSSNVGCNHPCNAKRTSVTGRQINDAPSQRSRKLDRNRSGGNARVAGKPKCVAYGLNTGVVLNQETISVNFIAERSCTTAIQAQRAMDIDDSTS